MTNEDSRSCEDMLDKARANANLEDFIRRDCPPLPVNFGLTDSEPDAVIKLITQSTRHHGRERWSPDTWRLYRWLYARLTERVDAEIGVVLTALKDAGLEDSTLVVFTSDHGDMDAAHQLAYKQFLYEEAVHIPFVMAFKGAIPGARVDRQHLVSNGLDLLPTLCDYAGIDRPAGLSGRSLRALAEGRDAPQWRCELITECQNGRMLRTARFKYCVYETGERRETLFDLENDPGEMKNLANASQYRDELNRHRRLLISGLEQNSDRLALSYAIKPQADTRPE